MSRISKLNSGRVQVTSPSDVSSDRYNWLSLDSAEPNLGTSGNGYVLTSNISGNRIWTNNLSIANVTANTITANYFYGNGAFLTGLASSNVNKIINGTTDITAYDSSNIAVTINGTANTAVFFGSNLVLSGYYYGDGSRLTGIVTSGNLLSNTDITIQTLTNGNIYLNAGGTGIVQIVGNDALGLPAGNDATRPLYPAAGYTRYNTDRQTIEYYDGNTWLAAGSSIISSEIINPDGVANTYTLGSNTTVDGVLVSINGTLQQPTYSYTIVNNNQIVFTEIPLTSDIVEIRFIAASTTSVGSLRFGPKTSVVLDSENVNIVGNIILNGSINNKSNILIPNIATTTIDSYSTTTWRTVKYIIQAVRASDVQSYETLVTHNGTIAVSNTYGILTIGNSLGSISASLIGSDIEVQYTPVSANTYLTVSRDFYPL